MGLDRKFLKQRISIGFAGLSRLGKMFGKKRGGIGEGHSDASGAPKKKKGPPPPHRR